MDGIRIAVESIANPELAKSVVVYAVLYLLTDRTVRQ